MREASVQRPPGRWLFEQPHVILDTRSPKEYEKGHITGAVSFPLFENDERAVIGTLYKQRGKDAAVEQGLEFVGPKMAEFGREAKERHAAQAAVACRGTSPRVPTAIRCREVIKLTLGEQAKSHAGSPLKTAAEPLDVDQIDTDTDHDARPSAPATQ